MEWTLHGRRFAFSNRVDRLRFRAAAVRVRALGSGLSGEGIVVVRPELPRGDVLLMALSRSSSGYVLGAAMASNLPWDRSLHRTRGVSAEVAPRGHAGSDPVRRDSYPRETR